MSAKVVVFRDLHELHERRLVGFPLTPSTRTAIVSAVDAAAPLLVALAERRDAAAILRVAEALTAAGHGRVRYALHVLDELAAEFRDPAPT